MQAGAGGAGPGGLPTQEQVQQAEQQKQAQEEQRKEILQKLLTPEANERLKRIALEADRCSLVCVCDGRRGCHGRRAPPSSC